MYKLKILNNWEQSYIFLKKSLTFSREYDIIIWLSSWYYIRRSGGTGRRPGLKIPWDFTPVPVRFRSPAPT